MPDTTTVLAPTRDLIIADAFTRTGGLIEYAQQMYETAAADLQQVLGAGRDIPDVGDLAEYRRLQQRCFAVRDLARIDGPDAHHDWLSALQVIRAECVASLARLNLSSSNPHARAIAESQAHADGRFLRQTAYLLKGV